MKLATRLRSTGMRFLASQRYAEQQRSKAQKRRIKRGDNPVVHYFHQADDPYSHLAVQKLDELRSHYQVSFQPHLTAGSEPAYRGSAAHFDRWARRDAASVAAHYGVRFSPTLDTLTTTAVAQANATLAAHLTRDTFAPTALEVGESLWGNQPTTAPTNINAGQRALADGTALQRSLGHYQGAMFYFESEWYWGVDRLRSLEQRLTDEGLANSPATLCVPEPTPLELSSANESGVVLEYFPSLRSPYTAIGHQRVLELIARSGVTVNVLPVMPMLMRGIPAPRDKQRYIIADAAREGRAHGSPLGRIVDPFGEPVKRAFALFAGAHRLGQAMAFVTAYLQAAWFDGVDITSERGLQQVAANAALDWTALLAAASGVDWESQLQDNLDQMLAHDLWGVPSFRVSGGKEDQAFACWGQDRIWRVEHEIALRSQ